MLRASAVTAMAFAAQLAAVVARAEHPASRITWHAPEGCPTQGELVERVERFLGQSFSERRTQVLVIHGEVNPSDAGYTARLRIESEAGSSSRQLAHPDCAQLTEAAALVIAIAIDPERAQGSGGGDEPTRVQGSEPAPLEAAEGSPLPALIGAPFAEWERPKRVRRVTDPDAGLPGLHRRRGGRDERLGERLDERSWTATVEGQGLVGIGLLPRAATGVALEPGVSFRSFRGGATLRRWAPQSERSSSFPSALLDVSVWTVGARGCGLSKTGQWTLSLCAGSDAVLMRGQGDGVSSPRARHTVWAAPTAGLGLAFEPAHRLRLTWALEGGLNLQRPRFGVIADEVQQVEIFRPARVDGTFAVGLGLRL